MENNTEQQNEQPAQPTPETPVQQPAAPTPQAEVPAQQAAAPTQQPDTPAAPASAVPETLEEKEMFKILNLCGIAGIIGVLVFWFMKKDENPGFAQFAKPVINFHISWTIWLLVPTVSCFLSWLSPFIAIGYVVFLVLGILKANEGKTYKFPATIAFLK